VSSIFLGFQDIGIVAEMQGRQLNTYGIVEFYRRRTFGTGFAGFAVDGIPSCILFRAGVSYGDWNGFDCSSSKMFQISMYFKNPI